jgi:hypothetical protein
VQRGRGGDGNVADSVIKVSPTGNGMVVRESTHVLSAFLLGVGVFLFFIAVQEWRSSGFSKDSIGASISCLGGLFFGLFFFGQRDVAIDVGRQHIEWSSTQLFLGGQNQTVPLRAIKSVIVQPFYDDSMTYRAAVITQDGTTIPITRGSGDRESAEQIAEYISGQIQSDGDSLIRRSIRELVAQHRLIDAVALAKSEYRLDTTAARAFVLGLSKREE